MHEDAIDAVSLQATTPAPLEITEFIEETSSIPKPPPGPGLLEAFGWMTGVFAAHLMAGVVCLIVILVMMAVAGENLQQLANLEQLPPSYLLLLMGGDQWLVLLLTFAAIRLRWGTQVRRNLNLTPLRPLHAAVVIGLVLPLSTLSGETYRLLSLVWKPLVEQFPVLEMLDESNAVELLSTLSSTGSLPMMLLIIAVAPAIGEELVFRGMIGRGLVARWGLVGGVLISSLMFAAVHFHPVHAAAVLPIGIALHCIYLATRSFWAPMLLHFLNNAWATVASRMATVDELPVVDEAPSPVLIWASLTAMVVLGAVLYRTRTRYILPDGKEWTPGYLTAEQPPAELGARIAGGTDTGRNLLMAATAWASFTVAFVAEIAAQAR